MDLEELYKSTVLWLQPCKVQLGIRKRSVVKWKQFHASLGQITVRMSFTSENSEIMNKKEGEFTLDQVALFQNHEILQAM